MLYRLLCTCLLLCCLVNVAVAAEHALPEGLYDGTDAQGKFVMIVTPEHTIWWRVERTNQSPLLADGPYKVTAFNVEAGLLHATFVPKVVSRGKVPLASTTMLGVVVKPGQPINLLMPTGGDTLVLQVEGADGTLEKHTLKRRK